MAAMPYSHQCPQCRKPVDPLRARAVALIDGHFLYFCSTSCRERQRTGREATTEVSAVQIIEAEPTGQYANLPASSSAQTAQHDLSAYGDGALDDGENRLPEPAGSGLFRWAVAAAVLVFTAAGLVVFLFKGM